jgi:hypothetical protein
MACSGTALLLFIPHFLYTLSQLLRIPLYFLISLCSIRFFNFLPNVQSFSQAGMY